MKLPAIWVCVLMMFCGCSHLSIHPEGVTLELDIQSKPGMSTLLMRELVVTAVGPSGITRSSRYPGIPHKPLELNLPEGRWHISARGYTPEACAAASPPMYIDTSYDTALQRSITLSPSSGYGQVVVEGDETMQAVLTGLDGRKVSLLSCDGNASARVLSGIYLLHLPESRDTPPAPLLVLPEGTSRFRIGEDHSLQPAGLAYPEVPVTLAGSVEEVPAGYPALLTASAVYPEDPMVRHTYLWYADNDPPLVTREPRLIYWTSGRGGSLRIQVVLIGSDAAGQILYVGGDTARLLVAQY